MDVQRIEATIDGVIAKEQGYVNHLADRGGATCWGITEFVARSYGWRGEMRDFPVLLARKIYQDRYIQAPKFDLVLKISPRVGAEVIDTGVNMGPAVAASFLQRWLNGFNFANKYQELFVDGRVGPATLDALQRFVDWRGQDAETALLRGLNSIQGNKYLALAEADLSQRDFLFGWMCHRIEM